MISINSYIKGLNIFNINLDIFVDLFLIKFSIYKDSSDLRTILLNIHSY